MNAYLKIFLTGLVSMGVSIAITFVIIIVTAGVTEHWPAGRFGPVLAGLLGAALVVFGAGIVVVNRVAASSFDRSGPVWGVTLLYSALAFVVMFVLGFFTLVLLNR